MNPTPRFTLMLALLLGLCCARAGARQPDGVLGLIRVPNEGMPAVLLAGQTFPVETLAKAELSLSRDGANIALTTTWEEFPGGRYRATATVPEGTAAAAYTLVAHKGPERDATVRAVYVQEKHDSYYVIAHVSDTHIGSNRHSRPSEAIITDVFAAVNASDADLAIITGDLTDGGSPEQFRKFLEVLNTLRVPSFVCPGNHDRDGLNYEACFGPLTYVFRYGPDGYLSFDSKDFVIADEIGEQDALLQRLRREIKPCRWSIGISHRYDPSMGMRAQFTLYVDDPLDYLLYGHTHRENAPDETHVPWGTTRISIVPAAINGEMRLIDATEGKGLIFRPVQQAATIE